MTKDMVDIIILYTGCSKSAAHQAVDALFNAIADRIALAGEVWLFAVGLMAVLIGLLFVTGD